MVRLRLKRIGRRHRPVYRVAAMDSRSPRDSRVIEALGRYDPANIDPDDRLVLKDERIKYWLSVGAQPSDTLRRILEKNGLIGSAS